MFLIGKNDNSQEINLALQPTKLSVAATSTKTGLTATEVASRVAKHQTNKTESKTSKTTTDILLSNLLTVFNFLTLGIAIWLLTVQSYRNLVYMGAVIINVLIGIFQELKAKKKIEELSLVAAPVAKVLRDGKIVSVGSDAIVLDDVLNLELGNQVCADCVVLKGKIEVNESLLTGESDAVIKGPGQTIFSGSYIIAGQCLAQVAHVGGENYIQKLAAQAKKYRKPKSEIMSSLKILIKVITVIVIVVGFLLFRNQYLNMKVPYHDAVVATAGSVIGMIPSGLFLLTSISLSLGVIKLSKRKVLVNDLYCIEMLARINTLCLDKTGTITDGTMRVKDLKVYARDKMPIPQLIGMIEGGLKERNATATALTKKFGKKMPYKPNATIPFSSVRKYSAASYSELGNTYLLGAPEFVFKKRYAEIQKDVEAQASLGYRVLLLARTNEPIKEGQELDERKFVALAIVSIEDTIRRDAIETINYFKKSGVAIKVISGDNPLTVSKIAKRAGVENADKYASLEGKTDEQLEQLALTCNVFGRVTPVQKKRLIEIYKKNSGVVAMTGDGVNDILAMKEADCAIAMANGSEATRSVAHLVLLDSDFSAMPATVKEGRRVINNIQRVATLFLTKTLFSFFLSIVVIIANKTYPMQTVQLLFFDVLVISIPSMYLAVEPNNAQIKGRFLQNVLVSAFPGAILVVLNYLAILGCNNFFSMNMSNEVISTVMVLATTSMGLYVLFKVCKPFNVARSIMYGLMWILFIYTLVNYSDFFAITQLAYPELFLAIDLILASLAIYPWLNRTALAVKNWILKIFMLKTDK